MRVRGWWIVIGCAGLAGNGCRAPAPCPVVLPAPSPPPAALVLAGATTAPSLEPDAAALPSLDPATLRPADLAPPPTAFLPLTEDVCRKEAAARATLANLLDREQATAAPDSLPCDVRGQLVAEARLRAATAAVTEFYQLADAEGRAEVLREAVAVLDRLRETVRKAKLDGLKVPVDLDDLDKRRGELLVSLSQADLGARLLDVDLKRRLGVAAEAPERLRPTDLPTVTTDLPPVDAAVARALEARPDLLALRAGYQRLNLSTLPSLRELLRGPLSPGGLAAAKLPALARRGASRAPDAATLADLALRRQQLFDLIAERERQAGDEVRAAHLSVQSQTAQVGLAHAKVDAAAAKRVSARDQGPLAALSAELDHLRARAELIAAVMAHHQARVKLQAAQGF